MNERRGDDDSSAKLLEYHHDITTGLESSNRGDKDGQEDTEGTSNQNHEEQANAKRDVVVSLHDAAIALRAAVFTFSSADAVPVEC